VFEHVGPLHAFPNASMVPGGMEVVDAMTDPVAKAIAALTTTWT
jgi:hypothetical protein